MPLPPPDSEETEPLIELKAGYILRKLDELPRQGTRSPWKLHQNYIRDIVLLRHGPLEDEGIEFRRIEVAARGTEEPALAA